MYSPTSPIYSPTSPIYSPPSPSSSPPSPDITVFTPDTSIKSSSRSLSPSADITSCFDEPIDPDTLDAAERGDVDDQVEVAEKYHFGPSKDLGEALRFYHLAADQDSAHALNSLGCMHRDGDGVEKDARKACMYFIRGHDGNDSQFNLGVLYLFGAPGVPQCHAQALAWFLVAAQNGDTEADFNVGLLYLYGNGVDQDFNEASKWFERAARESGDVHYEQVYKLCQQHQMGIWNGETTVDHLVGLVGQVNAKMTVVGEIAPCRSTSTW
tara:strand:- start:298 stop:1101 length:804 start_codon:yes stop_codon:yes gene_type:complete